MMYMGTAGQVRWLDWSQGSRARWIGWLVGPVLRKYREGWAWERRYDEEGWAYRPSAVHQRCMPRPARRRAPAKTVWFH